MVNTISLEHGEWVRSYSSGIWQIYRVLEYICLDPMTGKEHKKTTVFSKRFVSKSYKRSFSEECCSPFFIKPLTATEKLELETFISQNQGLYAKFVKYQPKALDCVYNARIGIPKDEDCHMVAERLMHSELMKESEINPFLKMMGYDTSTMPSWRVQFVSKDYECRDGFLMFRFSRVLEY